ncbi:MAG: dockerin type I domain-containing protein [Patescibacteria group bacterium]|nr:dockerin type I domain-containing protein [Patescibacteria group bacterium]
MMKKVLLTFLAVLALWTFIYQKNQVYLMKINAQTTGPQIGSINDNLSAYPNSIVPQYSKFELTFSINNTVATNLQFPYDASPPTGLIGKIGLSVDGLFTTDNWATTITQPGFLYQDYEQTVQNNREHLYPKGVPVWKIRFAPKIKGTYHYKIRATDDSGINYYPTNGDLTFSVGDSPPSNHGFIQVSPNDKRYFEFSDGTLFNPAGVNGGFDAKNDSLVTLDQKLTQQSNNGLNLFRLWMSGTSIAGSAWSPWIWFGGPWYGGYIPNSALWVNPQKNQTNPLYNPTASSEDYIFALNYNPPNTSAACLFTGWMNPPISVKPSTKYHFKVRALAENVTGPRNSAQTNYGLTLKIAGWPNADANSCPDALSSYSALTPYLNGNGWQTVEADYTTTGSQQFIDFLYMVMDNVNTGSYAHVAEVSMKEVLANGSLGPEILIKSKSDMQNDFNLRESWKWDYLFDRAAEKNIYFKTVVLEKNDRVWNMIKPDGTMDTTESNNNFYAVDPSDWTKETKVRRLQEYFWRYLAARWGYSTAVHSWEFVNEGDPFSGYHYTSTEAFAKYMHQNEPERHLVATSNWHSFPVDSFWGNSAYPDVDYADIHAYINTGSYNWSPPTGTYLETDSANVMDSKGGSIRVPAGKNSVNGDLGYPVKGQGKWTISVWMKINNYTGSCPYGMSSGLAGPIFRINMDGTGGFTRSIPYDPTDPNKYYVCTNSFTGTKDWTKFSEAFDIPDSVYHNLRVGFDTSYATTGTAWFDNLEITDPAGKKFYVLGDGTFDDQVRLDQDTAVYAQSLSSLYSSAGPAGAAKPTIRGETGIVDPLTGGEWSELAKDTQGVWLHKFIWGQINSGGISSLYWWQDAINKNNLWGQFKPFSNFMQGIPINNGHYQDAQTSVSDSNLRAWGQKDTFNGKAHLWIDNKTDTWTNVVNNPGTVTPASGTVTFSGMPIGSYNIAWVDPYTGNTIKTETLNVNGAGNILLTLPSTLTTDVAVKIDATSLIAGDINRDGKVDLSDLQLLFDNWNMPRDRRADVNGDGVVNGIDFALALKDFGKSP